MTRNLFARPNLSNVQFKQTSDSVLSLSGLTNISTYSGLTLSDGNGGQVLITASGASSGTTNNYVLTYFNGAISLKPSSASGTSTVFNTDRFTTRTGIPSVCVAGENTINNFLEGYFFPAVGPSSSLSIATGLNVREFGNSNVGNLSYSANRETHPICLVGLDTTANGSYDTFPVTTQIAGNCSGTQSYTFPLNCATPPSGTTETIVNYSVCVETICNEDSVSTANISWRNKVFTFKSTTLYNDSSIVAALSGGVLSTTKNKTLNNESFSNQFLYHVYPSSFGQPTVTVNGLLNNAWGNINTGTLYKINYTNVNGYLNQYYVMRSDNRITGSYNITIN